MSTGAAAKPTVISGSAAGVGEGSVTRNYQVCHPTCADAEQPHS